MTHQPTTHTTSPESTGGRYGAASGEVMRFLNSLRRLPAAEWLRVAEPADTEGPGDTRRASVDALIEEQLTLAARQRLFQAMESMPEVMRRITDRINMELTVLEAFVADAALQRMRRAAHLAAFALAAHHLLPREDVERLYRPFDALVPQAELLGA